MKITKICTMLTACFLLAGCNNAHNKNDNKNNDKEINENNNKNDGNNNNNNKEAEEQKITLEPNTPQSWIDMFTFDNVTISVDYNLSILTDYTYKCVGGKWYCKAERPEESFIEHNGRDIFDTYLTHYSIFTYNEEYSYYETSNWSDGDESGYVHTVHINVDENKKIVSINDTAELNSSSLVTVLSFTNYGDTTL